MGMTLEFSDNAGFTNINPNGNLFISCFKHENLLT